MTAPALAASRFAMAVAVGAVLGLIYGFLRPLRPRLTHLCDGMFVLCAFLGWIYLGFGLCAGDLRFVYTCGLAMGCVLWEATIGRLLRPVFSAFWHFLAVLTLPFQKIHSFSRIFFKKVFAKWKKWVTMERSIGRKRKRHETTGGAAYGKAKISPRLQKDQPHCEGRDRDRHRAVHHRAGHPPRHHLRTQSRV